MELVVSAFFSRLSLGGYPLLRNVLATQRIQVERKMAGWSRSAANHIENDSACSSRDAPPEEINPQVPER